MVYLECNDECLQERENIKKKIIAHGLLDGAMDKEFVGHQVQTLRKCDVHGARQEATPNNSYHNNKNC